MRLAQAPLLPNWQDATNCENRSELPWNGCEQDAQPRAF